MSKDEKATTGFSIVFSVGKWGGFYVGTKSFIRRICLGFFAIDFIPFEFDALVRAFARAYNERHKNVGGQDE